ncbi:uncharacterized protein LOC124946376 [Vespa velutina]|uniref:uncharacterized protein LOC124946376 n=1 Tax=Vespa velutina TaxID=202808 RepID=UPI001FB34D37|nr:uncharacterized protein LOC124946376 [Vespa velutina]
MIISSTSDTLQKATESPTSPQTLTSSRQIIRQAFLNRRIPDEAAEIMLDSITELTVKQYEGCLKKWLTFADEANFDAFNLLNTDVIRFLTARFNEGVRYGTINSTRGDLSDFKE